MILLSSFYNFNLFYFQTSTSLPCSPRRFANQGVVYLSEIQSVEDFKDLSAKQVKEILAMNRFDLLKNAGREGL